MQDSLTYKASGVDIGKANAFVRSIKQLTDGTKDKNVLEGKGGFGSLFALDKKYRHPVLVSSTDGVGTKLLIAQALGKHDTVGIDLVAMNVNDVLCMGAKPLFFLDYIACGRVDPKTLKDVVKGITIGCRESGCSLIGGETAEMPGMYEPSEYDLAGFTVGVVEKDDLIDSRKIKAGDRIMGLASSGLHSNGYSLARKVFSLAEQKSMAKVLLEPTRIYVRPVLSLMEKVEVKGVAHITGGAYYEKLVKIVPKGLCFSIDKTAWRIPDIFKLIQEKGNVTDKEMFTTFNMGIGMAVVVDPNSVSAVKECMREFKLNCWEIGKVVKDGKQKVKL